MQNEDTLNIREGGINWSSMIFMLFFHACAVLALFNFNWPALATAIFLAWVGGSLGIGIGYHRLLTHRGLKTPKWLEYFLATCATLSLQGGPIAWVAMHRIHHAHTEREGDPHSPRDGLWWSHMGWMLNGASLHREVDNLTRYVTDLAKDRFYVWLSRWHFMTVVALGAVLYLIGGWSFVLWGVFARVVFMWHATWFVNSAAHVWGSRRFETRDDSRNNWWVAMISFGEGWHNNHHAHPAAARHGLAWYEIDINWYGIWVLNKLGLAKNVRLVEWPKKTARRSERDDVIKEAA
jgi:sn-1 stearoyl-lipid 9-desaturase